MPKSTKIIRQLVVWSVQEKVLYVGNVNKGLVVSEPWPLRSRRGLRRIWSSIYDKTDQVLLKLLRPITKGIQITNVDAIDHNIDGEKCVTEVQTMISRINVPFVIIRLI